MRTSKITLAGEERVLCFSTRVIMACTERYGDVENIGEALTSGGTSKTLQESLWLLAQLMDAGARYCKMHDIKHADPLTVDELMDTCGIEDFAGLSEKIKEAITGGSDSSVEVESKNAKAIPGNL